MPPLAHVGHHLWILYVLPVIIVVIGIVRTTLAQRRERNPEED
jgi:cytochrome c-type biogenesis protein CcmH/NrfF